MVDKKELRKALDEINVGQIDLTQIYDETQDPKLLNILDMLLDLDDKLQGVLDDPKYDEE